MRDRSWNEAAWPSRGLWCAAFRHWGWRHGVIGLRSSATLTFEMSCRRHPTMQFRPHASGRGRTEVSGFSMGPGFAAPERKIVGIGDLPLLGILRLDHLVGNALARAIGHRIFPGVEAQGELLLHVAGRGPAHQGFDRLGLLGLVIELPFPGFGPARLHRVFGGLKNACGHGWSGPVGYATWKRLAETTGIVYRHLSGI